MAVGSRHVMIGHQHVAAISTTKVNNRKQKATGSKMKAESIEHARRNGFKMNYQTPTTVKNRSNTNRS
jgi:hypothetical protein